MDPTPESSLSSPPPLESGMDLLNNLKSVWEGKLQRFEEIQAELHSKDETISSQSKLITQVKEQLSKLQNELSLEQKRRSDSDNTSAQLSKQVKTLQSEIDVERSQRKHAQMKRDQLARYMLTALKRSYGASSTSSSSPEQYASVTSEELADVLKLLVPQRRSSTESCSSSASKILSPKEVIKSPSQAPQKNDSLKRKQSTDDIQTSSKRRNDMSLSGHSNPKSVTDPRRPFDLGAPNKNSDGTRTTTTPVAPKAPDQSKRAISSSSSRPIVFQLLSKHIKMAMMLANGKTQILANELGEKSIPFLVGLTKQGSLEYGTRVLNDIQQQKQDISLASHCQSSYQSHWWVTDYFTKSQSASESDDDEPWTENVQLSNGDFHKIRAEVLLAFILRKLKKHVEESILFECISSAVITVPFWFSSTHRIMVKDAGRLAGFSEVFLVNESSAAVFSPPSSSTNRAFPIRNILLLSENGGGINAFVYSYKVSSSTGAKRLIMLGSSSGDYSKESSHLKQPSTQGPSESQNLAEEKIVRDICKTAIEQSQDPDYNSGQTSSKPDEAIILAESSKWRGILRKVGRGFVDKMSFPGQENAVLLGASILSQNPSKIKEIIFDKLAFDVFVRKSAFAEAEEEFSYDRVISKKDRLPVKDKITSHLFEGPAQQLKFYQHVGTNRQEVICEVTLNPPIPPGQSVTVSLAVTNEGMVEFKDATFTIATAALSTRKSVLVKTPNLGREEWPKLDTLLEYLDRKPHEIQIVDKAKMMMAAATDSKIVKMEL